MLKPPDKDRCQADVPGNGPFTVGGKIGDPRNGYRVRCENKPTVIVTERVPGPDGLRGSMSLCATCLEAFHAQLGKDHADEERLAPASIGIGSTLWRFDENRRRYMKPTEKGRIWGDLIWREHWVEMFVIGETRVSWLVGSSPDAREPFKLPKAAFKDGGCPRGWALSAEHVDEHVWAYENRRRIQDAVCRCDDPRILRAIDEALKGKS